MSGYRCIKETQKQYHSLFRLLQGFYRISVARCRRCKQVTKLRLITITNR